MPLRIKRQTTVLPQLKGGELAQHNTTVYVGAIDEQSNIPLNPIKSVNGQTSGDIFIPTSPGAATGSFGFTSIAENVDETGTTHYNLSKAGKFRIGTRLNTVSPYMFALNVADTNPTLSDLLYSPIEILFDYLAFESPEAGTALSKIKLPDGFGDNEAHDNGELDLSALVGTVCHMGYLRLMVVGIDAEQAPGDTPYFRISDTLAVLVHEFRKGWYKEGAFIMLKTSSTNAAWQIGWLQNEVDIPNWMVTGAVSYNVNELLPTFDFSTPGEKVIKITNVSKVDYIQLHWSNAVEYFDINKITLLGTLDLTDNAVGVVDLTGNDSIEYITLGTCSLTSVVLPAVLTSVKMIDLRGNLLTQNFDFSTCGAMSHLYLQNNQVESVVLGANPVLNQIDLRNNNLSALDVSPLSGNGFALYIGGNDFTTETLNSILDVFIAKGTTGVFFESKNQTTGGTISSAKRTTLEGRGWTFDSDIA